MTAAPPGTLRAATRGSALALVQTELAAAALRASDPGLTIEPVEVRTEGDRDRSTPLSVLGGRGVFVRAVEEALLEGRADIAVHSLKDVPMELPARFAISTFAEREVPLDAFVSGRYASPEALPDGSLVGTSSLRRECQLRRAFPRLRFRALRGNVNTRLAKLDAGDYDAIILAAAGLRRLGFGERIRAVLPDTLTVPAIGQGILAIEYRRDREDLARLMAPFEHRDAAAAARAERALGLVVEGSCTVPVGGFARVSGDTLSMEGFLGMPDGSRIVRERASGRVDQAGEIGADLGRRLLAAGGAEILRDLAALRA
jgi:hydroxymethylbilane synthase